MKALLTILLILFCSVSYAQEGVMENISYDKATFAGGCFWCMEPPFEKLDGVIDVVSGYSGGKKKNPTYKEVSSGQTLYTESVQITYDPSKVSYEKLLDVFWMSMDPTTKDRSFNDVGPQYRSAIFYHNACSVSFFI